MDQVLYSYYNPIRTTGCRKLHVAATNHLHCPDQAHAATRVPAGHKAGKKGGKVANKFPSGIYLIKYIIKLFIYSFRK